MIEPADKMNANGRLTVQETHRFIQKFHPGTGRSSSYEEYLDSVLQKYSLISYERQFKFGDYVVDFAFPEAKAFLEIDGIYHEIERTKKRDKGLNKLADQFGIVVLRSSPEEIATDVYGLVNHLNKLLTQLMR